MVLWNVLPSTTSFMGGGIQLEKAVVLRRCQQPLGGLVVWGGVLGDGSFGLWEGWESGEKWILPSSDEGFWGLWYVHINSHVGEGGFDFNTVNTTPCSGIVR
jgi:hypothetical protein